MTRYLISFDAHGMDHIPADEMPAVAKAAHEVVQEALNSGVWVFDGGLEHRKATVVPGAPAFAKVARGGTVSTPPWGPLDS